MNKKIYVVVNEDGEIEDFFEPQFEESQANSWLKGKNKASYYVDPVGYKFENHKVVEYIPSVVTELEKELEQFKIQLQTITKLYKDKEKRVSMLLRKQKSWKIREKKLCQK